MTASKERTYFSEVLIKLTKDLVKAYVLKLVKCPSVAVLNYKKIFQVQVINL